VGCGGETHQDWQHLFHLIAFVWAEHATSFGVGVLGTHAVAPMGQVCWVSASLPTARAFQERQVLPIYLTPAIAAAAFTTAAADLHPYLQAFSAGSLAAEVFGEWLDMDDFAKEVKRALLSAEQR
jgi:hypothetical protein